MEGMNFRKGRIEELSDQEFTDNQQDTIINKYKASMVLAGVGDAMGFRVLP